MGNTYVGHGIRVNFDKICIFCDKYIFIIIKIKYVNSDKINDICDKVNFIINYTHFTIPDIYFIKTQNILSKHTYKYY